MAGVEDSIAVVLVVGAGGLDPVSVVLVPEVAVAVVDMTVTVVEVPVAKVEVNLSVSVVVVVGSVAVVAVAVSVVDVSVIVVVTTAVVLVSLAVVSAEQLDFRWYAVYVALLDKPGDFRNSWQTRASLYVKNVHVASAEHNSAQALAVAMPVSRLMRPVLSTCFFFAVAVYPDVSLPHVLSVAVTVVVAAAVGDVAVVLVADILVLVADLVVLVSVIEVEVTVLVVFVPVTLVIVLVLVIEDVSVTCDDV